MQQVASSPFQAALLYLSDQIGRKSHPSGSTAVPLLGVQIPADGKQLEPFVCISIGVEEWLQLVFVPTIHGKRQTKFIFGCGCDVRSVSTDDGRKYCRRPKATLGQVW